MNYQLKIIFGKEEVNKFYNDDRFTVDEIVNNVKEFHFKTESEMEAFIKGIEASSGWTEYSIIEQKQHMFMNQEL